MSKKRRSPSNSVARSRSSATAKGAAARGGRRRLALAALGMVCAAAVTLFILNRELSSTSPRPLPEISTVNLEPAAASLLQRLSGRVRQDPRSAEAWGTLGGVLRSFLYTEEAVQCLEEAMRLAPEEPRWPYLLATLTAGTDPSSAIARLRRAVELCGNEPETPRLQLARLLLQTGAFPEARAELEALLEAKPNLPVAQLELARVCRAENDWAGAIALARDCTGSPYTTRAGWTLLGALYQRAADTNAAQLADRRARDAAPDVPWPDPFEASFRNLRTDSQALSDRAEEYLLAGQPVNASPLIRQLTNDYPEFAQGWLLCGRMLLLQQDPVAAEPILRRFLRADPQSVNGNFQLGLSLLRQNRFEEAADVFRAITERKSDFGPAFFNLGFALAKSGRPAEAVSPFQEAIRHNPETIDAYILLADLLLELGHPSRAVELAADAERLNPNDPRIGVLRKKLQNSTP